MEMYGGGGSKDQGLRKSRPAVSGLQRSFQNLQLYRN